MPPEVPLPAGLLYEPGFGSSRLYRQEPPTPSTMRETSSREKGNYGREMSCEFCRQIASSTLFEGIFNMPQICDIGRTALLHLRRKARWGFFRPEPRTWVPEASMLTSRPPKPLTIISLFYFKSSTCFGYLLYPSSGLRYCSWQSLV
jgi:hypothetical protein